MSRFDVNNSLKSVFHQLMKTEKNKNIISYKFD